MDRATLLGTAHPDAAPSARRVVLDASSFPHILDSIIGYAPRRSLVGLRAVSRSMRMRVDARLAEHLELGMCTKPMRAQLTVQPCRWAPALVTWSSTAIGSVDTAERVLLSACESSSASATSAPDTFPPLTRIIPHARVLDLMGPTPPSVFLALAPPLNPAVVRARVPMDRDIDTPHLIISSLPLRYALDALGCTSLVVFTRIVYDLYRRGRYTSSPRTTTWTNLTCPPLERLVICVELRESDKTSLWQGRIGADMDPGLLELKELVYIFRRQRSPYGTQRQSAQASSSAAATAASPRTRHKSPPVDISNLPGSPLPMLDGILYRLAPPQRYGFSTYKCTLVGVETLDAAWLGLPANFEIIPAIRASFARHIADGLREEAEILTTRAIRNARARHMAVELGADPNPVESAADGANDETEDESVDPQSRLTFYTHAEYRALVGEEQYALETEM